MKGENWVLTKLCKGITGSGNEEYINKDKVKDTMIYDFRLVNEDGVICAYGKSDTETTFEPLSYYGQKYGCVTMEYRKQSYWLI